MWYECFLIPGGAVQCVRNGWTFTSKTAPHIAYNVRGSNRIPLDTTPTAQCNVLHQGSTRHKNLTQIEMIRTEDLKDKGCVSEMGRRERKRERESNK